MDNLKSKKWWEKASVRAIKTGAQTLVVALTGVTLISEVSILHALSGVALSMVLSFATSLAGLPEVEKAEETEEQKEDIEKK